MAVEFFYSLEKEARLLHSSITVKSAPKLKNGQTAEPKFSGTFGIDKVDFDKSVEIMVRLLKEELGSFSNPADYYLACMSGTTAAKRTILTAELETRGMPADEALKMMEKAEKRAEMYRQYAGVLSASSKFDISLARLEAGKVIDIPAEEHARAQAGKDLFYPGAFVVPAVKFRAYRRKTLDAKDGVTAYLQNCLYVRKGETLGGGGRDNNDVFGGFKGYSPEDPTALAPTIEGESDF